jgi:glycosyltransferase involved in cell wall biosynthesis
MTVTATDAPRFTILLPTHNRADVLPYSVRSVLYQTVQDFELLIVGDGCTDETAEVVRSFDDARIRWFDLPKAPHFGYANRNVALREARGALVAFMAHDDLWLPDHLQLLAAAFDAEDVELAYSRPLWVIPKGMIAPSSFNLHQAETLHVFLSRRRNHIPAGCVVHRRECFEKYGYWNDQLSGSGDWDMWARIIEGGGRRNFSYVTESTCLHFRANWRTEATTGQPQLLVWKMLHAIDGFMPEALSFPVTDGETEQEACWKLLSADSEEWTKRLRAAVHQVLDRRVAQSDELMLEIIRRTKSNEAETARLVESFAQMESLRELTTEIEHARSSFGWKLVHGLRALKSRTLPPGTRRERAWLRIQKNLLR